jgi:hypothetical protein
MQYVEAPTECEVADHVLFMAGGITGCPDWQAEFLPLVEGTPWTLVNPRRKNFPIHDPDAARAQIEWEHRHLARANARLFWFPCETLCPIVLFELGAWSKVSGLMFVGVHPKYQRRSDVEIQLELARPDVRVVYSLEDLARQVKESASKPTVRKRRQRVFPMD